MCPHLHGNVKMEVTSYVHCIHDFDSPQPILSLALDYFLCSCFSSQNNGWHFKFKNCTVHDDYYFFTKKCLRFAVNVQMSLNLLYIIPSYLHTPEPLLPNINICLQSFLLSLIIPKIQTIKYPLHMDLNRLNTGCIVLQVIYCAHTWQLEIYSTTLWRSPIISFSSSF